MAEIDVSCRFPIVLMFSGAVLWLVLGTGLALLGQVKLHAGEFLVDSAWLAYGRIRPAWWNALVFGFGSQAALATALWIICRLGRVTLVGARAVATAAVFWNVGVLIGGIGILVGDSTGVEGLELPGDATPILFLALLTIAVGAGLTFRARREREIEVSHWFMLVALVWFPWVYATANLLLVFRPVCGGAQIVVNGWFLNNLRELWLVPLGLAAVFYFLPKLRQRPLHSRFLAAFTLWLLVLSGSWGGVLTGLPLPRWITALSTAASLIMILPVLAVAANCYHTWRHGTSTAPSRVPLRFILAGVASYILSALLGAMGSFGPVHEVTRLTHFSEVHSWLEMVGFVAMTFAGAIY